MSFESLNHSRCNFKYHNIFIPNERKKFLYGTLWDSFGSGIPLERGFLLKTVVAHRELGSLFFQPA